MGKTKRYKYEEWTLDSCVETGFQFADRIYRDLEGNLITGILEGFYSFGDLPPSHERNCQMVVNGKVEHQHD
jgi:hypothetical protein